MEKPTEKQIDLRTLKSETLALLLNQCYNAIMQNQQNILNINQILQQREQNNADVNANPADGPTGTVPQAPDGD